MTTNEPPLAFLPEPQLSRPPVGDILLATLVTIATAFWGDLFGRGPMLPEYLASVLTSILLTGSLAFRRWRPMVMTIILALGGLLQTIFVPYPTWALVAVPMAAYSSARWVIGHRARWVVVAGGIGSIVGPLRWFINDPTFDPKVDLAQTVFPLMLLCLAWVIMPYLLGRRDQEQALAEVERARSAQQRYETEIAKRDEQARATEARVRNEIARELHDIVAHSLSVIIVQAEGGKALARKKPEQAAEVLGTISDTGREALTEMRRIVGVLRGDPNAKAEFQPSPGLPEIEALVERAGDNVHLTINGTQPAVGAGAGLTVYRVIQEALTNVLKHAAADAKTEVTVDYLEDRINVTVYDDGGTETDLVRPAEVSGPGFGIKGMTERVSAMGGTLTSKPSGTGWVVNATIPINRRSDR